MRMRSPRESKGSIESPSNLDHPQVAGIGPEPVADERVGEQPRLSGLPQFAVPGFRIRLDPDIGLRQGAVADRRGVCVGGRRPRGLGREPVAPVVLEEFGPAAQMLGQDLAVVLGEDLRRALADELLQVGVVPAHCDRGGAQVRPLRRQQPAAHRIQRHGVLLLLSSHGVGITPLPAGSASRTGSLRAGGPRPRRGRGIAPDPRTLDLPRPPKGGVFSRHWRSRPNRLTPHDTT